MENLDAQTLRELQVLDDLASSFFVRACAGDPRSAEIMIGVSERRAKILGIDAPTRSSLEVISYDAGVLREEYENLKREIHGNGQEPLD